MFINAQSDFVNYLILDVVNDAPMGTALWLVHQAIEKYLKALLLKLHVVQLSDLRRREFGHNLIVLLEHYKNANPASKVFETDDYTTLIRELDTDGENTGIRYSAGIYINEPFTRIFIELCTILRLDFLGGSEFNKHPPFGLGGRGDRVAQIVTAAYSKHRIAAAFLYHVKRD